MRTNQVCVRAAGLGAARCAGRRPSSLARAAAGGRARRVGGAAAAAPLGVPRLQGVSGLCRSFNEHQCARSSYSNTRLAKCSSNSITSITRPSPTTRTTAPSPKPPLSQGLRQGRRRRSRVAARLGFCRLPPGLSDLALWVHRRVHLLFTPPGVDPAARVDRGGAHARRRGGLVSAFGDRFRGRRQAGGRKHSFLAVVQLSPADMDAAHIRSIHTSVSALS